MLRPRKALVIEKSSRIIACCAISGISSSVTRSNGDIWLNDRLPVALRPTRMKR